MQKDVSLGFVGFGEAGFELAKGLRSEGISKMVLYDRALTELLENRASKTGVKIISSLQELVEKSELILSVVSPEASIGVSRELQKYLKPKQFFLDLTPSFPDDMKKADEMVTKAGAHFIDGAMMGALPVDGHKVLIYVAGIKAETAARHLNELGMNVKAIGNEPGKASAVKLILSVATKGFGSVLTEMLLSSHYFGIDEPVLEALEEFYKKGLRAYIDRTVGSSAIHAGRRVIEMEASAKLLKSIGVAPIMTEATISRLKWIDSQNLSTFFNGEVPASYREVLTALEKIGFF